MSLIQQWWSKIQDLSIFTHRRLLYQTTTFSGHSALQPTHHSMYFGTVHQRTGSAKRSRYRRTSFRMVEVDLPPHNLGLNSAWQIMQDHSRWFQLWSQLYCIKGARRRLAIWWWTI